QFVRARRHLPLAGRAGRPHAARGAPRGGAGAARHARRGDARRPLLARSTRAARPRQRVPAARWPVRQRHRRRRWHTSTTELLALATSAPCAIARGRSLFASDLAQHLEAGVGWVPATHALTPLGPLAEPNPFGSTGDLRLLPDTATRARVAALGGHTAF